MDFIRYTSAKRLNCARGFMVQPILRRLYSTSWALRKSRRLIRCSDGLRGILICHALAPARGQLLSGNQRFWTPSLPDISIRDSGFIYRLKPAAQALAELCLKPK